MDDETKQYAITCSTVLGGMLIVAGCLIGIVKYASDSDLADALQECAKIRVYNGNSFDGTAVKDASVDECRKQAFEFYAKHNAE